MLKRNFDVKKSYRVVLYLRMSSDDQNKRSPEQQKKEINLRLKSLRLPWRVVKVYCDAAKTGRLLRKRRDYQTMMRELKTGTVVAELILVDTMERFGRVDELPTIRKELEDRYGILVLAADTNFADPTTPQGRAMGMFEAMRATEEGRIKAHNVFRGKRDTVELGHWPGGNPPFGFRLKSVMTIEKGREVVDYCLLVPDPEKSWIIVLLFEQAKATGWGQTRLSRFLNSNDQIPKSLKPFQPSTVGLWLDSEIYYGDFVWPKLCSGIVDDALVRVPTKPDEITRYPNFCDALVLKELWSEVQRLRNARRSRTHGRKPKTDESKRLLEPFAMGLVMKYLLTGLVCCGHCRRSMTPSSGPGYTTKAGEFRRYVSYLCPGYVGGHCPNSTRVPEDWLRETVVRTVTERLFPRT